MQNSPRSGDPTPEPGHDKPHVITDAEWSWSAPRRHPPEPSGVPHPRSPEEAAGEDRRSTDILPFADERQAPSQPGQPSQHEPYGPQAAYGSQVPYGQHDSYGNQGMYSQHGPHGQEDPFWHPGVDTTGIPPVVSSASDQGGAEERGGTGRLAALVGAAVLCVAMVSMTLGWVVGRGGEDSEPATKASQSQQNQRGGTTLAAQARAVDALLDRSRSARDEVVTAVVQTKQCRATAQGTRALRSAARKRERLAAELDKLNVGKLPNGAAVVDTLGRAWKKSAAADRAFAAWAVNVGGPNGCTGGTPVRGTHYRQAVQASAAASRAKAKFVSLWNGVAARTGLPRRSQDEI